VIRLVNLDREFAEIGEEVMEAIRRVCMEGSFILGHNVEEFEREFATYVGSKYGCGVGSGTDALRLALEAAGVGPGDEVVTVSNSFVATADSIRMVGARPIFVDVDPHTYTMDPDAVEAAITPRTKAVIPVHLYGQPAELDRIRETCQKHSLLLVQDACQAHGAQYRGRRLGEYGDVLCYSFYPSKCLGAYGDGGMITTDNQALAQRCKQLRNYGQTKKYHHDFLGYNSRLDELQAAVLRVKLKKLEEWIQRRRFAAKTYNELFSGNSGVVTPYERPDARHVYYLYVVQVNGRDQISVELKKQGVETGIHYPIPIHMQKSYSDHTTSRLPNTERLAPRILSIPLDPFLKAQELQLIANYTRSLAKKYFVA
jgi:dTDP-4-amino-4,6-dideoxygalactose transaminase